MKRLHATAVVYHGRGLLLRGQSGSGKSDLALRLIHAGGTLVADDYVDVFAKDHKCLCRTPENIHGLIEMRGLGLIKVPHSLEANLDMIVNCCQTPLDRLPEQRTEILEGVALPVIDIHALEASAVAKISLLLHHSRLT